MQLIFIFISGLVFALGLGLSGMMSPQKVQGFLDLAGQWDPSLAMVMGGAVVVTLIAFPLVTRRKSPLFSLKFYLPTRRDIDLRLVLGSGIFGAGWAISGLCPGPALANTATLRPEVLLYLAAMLFGFWLQKRVLQAFDKSASHADNKAPLPNLDARST